MLRLPRPRLTYANVVATLALFIALGGGAYAAMQLPKNSVGTKQIKKGAVTPAKLSGCARSSFKGVQGQVGPQGPRGEPGPPGSGGSAGGILASGQSESGTWGAGYSSSGEYIAINFAPPLAEKLPEANLHFMGAETSPSCAGPGHAASGHLCVYGGGGLPFGNFQEPASFGVTMYMFTPSTSTTGGFGTWTVTAP